jgi:hypothetical protein
MEGFELLEGQSSFNKMRFNIDYFSKLGNIFIQLTNIFNSLFKIRSFNSN